MDSGNTLRERLVDVGVELVLAEGTGAVGLREIARRAGVSHGAPRRYFPTHRSLLSAIARRGFEELSARSDAAVAAATTPRERLAAMAEVYVAYAMERRGMFELMFRHDLLDSSQPDTPPGQPRLREATLPMFEGVVDLVAQCRAEPTRPESARTAAALWANIHGIAELWSWGSLPLVLGDGVGQGPQNRAAAGDSIGPDHPGGVEQLIESALRAHLGPAAR